MRWIAVALCGAASLYFLLRRGRARSRASAKRSLKRHIPGDAFTQGAGSRFARISARLAAAAGEFRTLSGRQARSGQCDLLVASLTTYMQCGVPFEEALSLCVQDLLPPVREHLLRFSSQLELGADVPHALAELVRALDSRDFELVAMAAVTSRETGSDIRSVMRALGEAARERAAIRRELDTQTIQGRLSGRIVAGLPLIFLSLSCAVSRGTLSVLFGSPAGILMLAAAGVLNLFGFLWIRKILDVETW